MQFVFVNNYFYLRGGSERVFLDEIEMLEANGHEVAPFTRHYPENLPSAYSQFFGYHLEYDNVGIRKKLAATIELTYSLECKRKFTQLLEHFKPDVIHAHNIYGRISASVLDVAKAHNIPVVLTLHDYKLICPSYLMLLHGKVCEKCSGRFFYNCLLTRCHRGNLSSSLIYTVESYFNRLFKKYESIRYIICPSRFSLNKHREAGLPESKLIHLPNFIKVRDFEPSFSSGQHVLFVGRLSKEKGVLTLIRAVQDLDVLVRIVGSGPMRDTYEAYVKEHGILNVTFEGYQSGGALKELYRNAAFLVFPSEWYENAPMTILEAFAYGKPVVGSNIGGIPEMIREGQTGMLFKTGDHLDLREKIKCLLTEPSTAIRMGKLARARVESDYQAGRHYEQLVELYKTTVGP